jgi:hypothetical protein
LQSSKVRWVVGLVWVAALAMSGCGGDSDGGSPAITAADGAASPDSSSVDDGGALDALQEPEAAIGQDSAASDVLFPPGLKVNVTYHGATTQVDLNQPPLLQDSGYDYSRVSDVIGIAVPDRALASLAADFVGSDGYNPQDKPGCGDFVPVVGQTLTGGWIDRKTRYLNWDPAVGMAGCVKLKDLAEILVSDH